MMVPYLASAEVEGGMEICQCYCFISVFCTAFLNNFLIKSTTLNLRKIILICIFIRASDLMEIQGVLVE